MTIVKTYDPIQFHGTDEAVEEIIAFADNTRGVLLGRDVDDDMESWWFFVEVHEPYEADRGDCVVDFIQSKQNT